MLISKLPDMLRYKELLQVRGWVLIGVPSNWSYAAASSLVPLAGLHPAYRLAIG